MKLKRAKEENSYSKEYVEILFSAIFCTEFFAIECIVEPGLVCGAEDWRLNFKYFSVEMCIFEIQHIFIFLSWN